MASEARHEVEFWRVYVKHRPQHLAAGYELTSSVLSRRRCPFASSQRRPAQVTLPQYPEPLQTTMAKHEQAKGLSLSLLPLVQSQRRPQQPSPPPPRHTEPPTYMPILTESHCYWACRTCLPVIFRYQFTSLSYVTSRRHFTHWVT